MACWTRQHLMLASCSRLLLVVPPAETCVWVAFTSKSRGFGTVCKFGSSIDSRPVAVAVWQKWPLILTRLGPCSCQQRRDRVSFS